MMRRSFVLGLGITWSSFVSLRFANQQWLSTKRTKKSSTHSSTSYTMPKSKILQISVLMITSLNLNKQWLTLTILRDHKIKYRRPQQTPALNHNLAVLWRLYPNSMKKLLGKFKRSMKTTKFISLSAKTKTVMAASLPFTFKNVSGTTKNNHFAKTITTSIRIFLSANKKNKISYLRPSGKSATKRFNAPFFSSSLKIKKSRNQRLPTCCTRFKWSSHSNLPLNLSHLSNHFS